ncbi:hypothetical protein A3G69_02000 [Candidatus Peribacteria bacterium RIFCSPLOWO2_12_FULL_53_10]|nr:MAG: hypothetical protein A3B61_01990 [Candidatus Peribacteria bacterium RIFCSPLOWO2_01_FULL_53_10]OGJ75031.1 MAG: hypothetical protein A3G69_02000 [Candidatus Peribacteria bacterium RIFCSPLOWO2_12_FULL_53_10]
MSDGLPEDQNIKPYCPIHNPKPQPDLEESAVQSKIEADAIRRDIQVPLHPAFKSTEQLQVELTKRRESGELHPDPVSLDYIKRNQPLCRSALTFQGKEQAVELTMPELCDVAAANPSQAFEFVNVTGDVVGIEPFQARGGKLILFPEDFGD